MLIEELKRQATVRLSFGNLPAYHILCLSRENSLHIPQMAENNACEHFAMFTVSNLILEFQTLDKIFLFLFFFSFACILTGMLLH